MTENEETTLQEAAAQQQNFSFGKLLFSGFIKFIYIIAFFALVNIFISSSYVVGTSMNDTLHDGEYLLGVRTPFTKLKRGDIVNVKHDGSIVVKRLIGLAGDVVEINEEQGLLVNGIPFKVDQQGSNESIFGKWEVSDGHVFIIGDNRSNSKDSRIYGEVPVKDVVCKVFFRYYPFYVWGGL